TNMPLVKAALLALYEAWPGALPFDAVLAAARQRLGRGAAAEEGGRGLLAQALLQLYLSNLAALHAPPPPFGREPGDRPLASPLARLQAADGDRVTSRLHKLVDLEGVDRYVLLCLDGTRDRAAIADALAGAVASGRVELRHDGQPLRDAEEIRA